MYFLVYSKQIENYPEGKIETNIKAIESETGLQSYEPMVEEGLKKTLFADLNSGRFISSLPLKMLEVFAQELFNAYQLPKDRYQNILNDLLTFHKFSAVCDNEDIELLQELQHTQSIETMYKYPCKYILRSKQTGIQTPPSENIDDLLNMFKNIIKK